MRLDETDRKILSMLEQNGRMSYVDMGKELSLSRVAVRDRVNHLYESGIIEKFSIVVNSEKIGKKVSAFFEVEVEPYYLEKVGNTLGSNPNVANIYQMTGPSTLHMHVLVEDMAGLEKFINEELYAVEGITRVASSILLKRFKSREGIRL